MKDLSAIKINTSGQLFNASDLANDNLLYAKNTIGAAQLNPRNLIGNKLISIYPNPVFGSEFKIIFNNNTIGEYDVAVTDVQGKLITSKRVFIKSAGQPEIIQMKTKPANGLYLINVTNANKKSVFSDKIVIE
jgi:hypothetical protein